MDMTKPSVKESLGIKSDAALARYFGCSRSAVTQWGDEKPIPTLRQYELRDKQRNQNKKRQG
jgi:hypothetical protein